LPEALRRARLSAAAETCLSLYSDRIDEHFVLSFSLMSHEVRLLLLIYVLLHTLIINILGVTHQQICKQRCLE